MSELPLVADTGGLLRALAATPQGKPAFPEFQRALVEAAVVVVPPLILAEMDYVLRDCRLAMRKLIAELLDPATRYELEPILPQDLARAVHLDEKFKELSLGIVDSSVAAVAERRRIFRVLTDDRRHFSALRVGPRYQKALRLVP